MLIPVTKHISITVKEYVDEPNESAISRVRRTS